QPEAETSDAIYFANKMGVVCDVHHRVRLFEGQESINLITHLQPKHMKVPTMPVLEPNAMVVHLIVHMDGHRHETGPMLCWILDLAFVLRKWGTLIKPEYIEKLMPAKENLVSLFRIVRFLEQEFDQQLPACLTQGAKNFEPLTLAEIFRQRRLALWGLPRPNGWLRLGASQLGFQLLHRRPKLQIDDLLLLPLDTLRNLRIYNRLIPIKKYHLNQAKAGR
ncbi:MAG: nucleotidyltransferase family protein, partial [Merismopedia sp. SIO2A8]|nr:nucleotidyltransferase family protein [Merismopedia sp. SIO2A8]